MQHMHTRTHSMLLSWSVGDTRSHMWLRTSRTSVWLAGSATADTEPLVKMSRDAYRSICRSYHTQSAYLTHPLKRLPLQWSSLDLEQDTVCARAWVCMCVRVYVCAYACVCVCMCVRMHITVCLRCSSWSRVTAALYHIVSVWVMHLGRKRV